MDNPKNRERRPVFRQLPYGAVPDYAPLCLDPDDAENQYLGLRKRLGAVVGTDDSVLLNKFSKFVQKVISRLPPLTSVSTIEEWLSGTHYNENRKNELRNIAAKIDKYGLPKNSKLSRVSPFIKRESYPENKHARWINAPSDYFKVLCGPCFKDIERVVYDFDFFGKGHSQFIKHVPVSERPSVIAKLKELGVKFFGTDFTAFESSMVQAIMDRCELLLYKHMLQHFPQLCNKICNVLRGKRRGVTRAGVSFKCNARRMSGDNCTSLGNGFTNLMTWAFLCCELGIQWDGYVEGDDGIFVTNGKSPTQDDYKKLGFNIKIVEANDPADLSFCGLILAGGVVLRDPRKFFQNFGWSSSFLFSKLNVQMELLRAKALSALYETPACPLVTAIAKRALEITEGHQARFVFDGYHDEIGEIISRDIPFEARLKFSQLFGISVEDQIMAENRIIYGEELGFLSELLPSNHDVHDYATKYLAYG